MIFRYLGQRELQDTLGETLLKSLEKLLPPLRPNDFDETDIYRKEMLLRILVSFSPSQRLKDKNFMRTLLNSVPEDVLGTICEKTGVGISSVTFDERVTALVSRGWHDTDFCKNFIEAAGLPSSFLPTPKVSLPNEELCEKSAWPYKRLKDYQTRVYEKSYEHLVGNLARCVIQMPTGSGKTRTAMEIISDFINQSSPNAAVIWLAHSEELCEQAIACFRDIWAHIGERDVRLCRCFGSSSSLPFDKEGTLFVVGGFQKLHSMLKRDDSPFDIMRDRTVLLVVDEAHKVLAPTYKAVTKALIGPLTRVVGLTATPGRSASDIDQNQELAGFFFNKIIGIEVPDYISVFSFLRKREIMSRVVRDPLITDLKYELTSAQVKYLNQRFDFPPNFLGELGRDQIRNFEIVKRILKECSGGGQILFFGCSVEHSQFICAVLSFFEVKAAHIDGGTPKSERSYIIESFRKSNLQVLCNYGVLSTGFDAPKTDVVFISRPTSSLVLYSQMIGRGLRGPAIGGTPRCKIIDVVDNIIGLPEEDKIYDYFEEYWMD